MFHSAQLFAFLVPTLALNLTPGPDMLFVISQSTNGGHKAALKAALGLWLGYLFHIALVSVGLASLFRRHPEAFYVMKAVGGLYLLFLGVKLLTQRTEKISEEKAAAENPLLKGIFVSALNPKVAIFFLAFLPQFIHPADPYPARQIILLGFLFSVTSTIVNTGAGFLAHGLREISIRPRYFSAQKFCGLVMVGMAARLALSR